MDTDSFCEDVDAFEAAERIESEPDLVVLDLRTPMEYAEGHLPRWPLWRR